MRSTFRRIGTAAVAAAVVLGGPAALVAHATGPDGTPACDGPAGEKNPHCTGERPGGGGDDENEDGGGTTGTPLDLLLDPVLALLGGLVPAGDEEPADEEPVEEEPPAEEPPAEEPPAEQEPGEQPAPANPLQPVLDVLAPVLEQLPAFPPADEEPGEQEPPAEQEPGEEEPPAEEEPGADEPAPANPVQSLLDQLPLRS